MTIYEFICPVEYGGGENQILLRAIEMKKNGINVGIVCMANSETFRKECEKSRIPFFVLTNQSLGYSPSMIKYLLHTILTLPALVRKARIFKVADVINANQFPPNLVLILLKYLFPQLFKSKVLVYTQHSYSRSNLFLIFRKFFKYIIARYDKIIAVSSKVKEESLVRVFPSLSSKIEVIPNGISLEEFSLGVDKNFIRRGFGLSPDEIIAIYPARFSLSKNHRFLIDCLLSVDNFKLVLAGDGSERESFLHLVDSAKVADRIIITGYLQHSDLVRYLYASDFCLFPSLIEGLSVAIIESMMAGLSVVIFDRIYTREYGSNILVAKDEGEFIKYTRRLVQDKNFREDLSAKVKCDAIKLSITETTKRYIELYKTLIFDKQNAH